MIVERSARQLYAPHGGMKDDILSSLPSSGDRFVEMLSREPRSKKVND